MVYSLDGAKQRRQAQAFKAEGTKCVLDTLAAFPLVHLISTRQWWEEYGGKVSRWCQEPLLATPAMMERMTSLSTAPNVIAVYQLPDRSALPTPLPTGLILALDGVQDPGNLGTIIRTADWFGISLLLCSPTTADAYSPKVVMSTMGAISRVRPVYCDLASVLSTYDSTIVGMALDGTPLPAASLPSNAIIVMGSEGHGLSPQVEALISQKLLIPSWPPERPTSESLNVATATAITLYAFRNR